MEHSFRKGTQMKLLMSHAWESMINAKAPSSLTFQDSKLEFSLHFLVGFYIYLHI